MLKKLIELHKRAELSRTSQPMIGLVDANDIPIRKGDMLLYKNPNIEGREQIHRIVTHNEMYRLQPTDGSHRGNIPMEGDSARKQYDNRWWANGQNRFAVICNEGTDAEFAIALRMAFPELIKMYNAAHAKQEKKTKEA